MKFLPESQRKKNILVGILVVCVLGIVYFNFFTGPSKSVPPPGKAALPQQTPATATSPSSPTAVRRPQSGLLPYGADIDLGILKNDKFRELKSTPPVSVNPQELGKDNLFGP